MFTFLTFAIRYPLRGTKTDIITLLPVYSLTDFDRFIISAAIFSGSPSLLISLVPWWMTIFSGFFYGWFSMPMHVARFCSSERLQYNFLFIIWEFPSLYVLDHWISQNDSDFVNFFTCCCVFLWQLITRFSDLFLVSLLFFYLNWFCLSRQLSLVLHNARYYSHFQHHNYLIILGID